MKLTKNILIASAMVFFSAQAFADDVTYSDQTVFTAESSIKAIAYEQGMAKLNALQTASSNELEAKFWWLGMPANNMAIEEGAYVTVMEKMNASGQIVYSGVVHVSVSYESDDNEQDAD